MQARNASRARRRVVAIAPNWLGDAVMALPALGVLARAPDASLCVLSAPYVARVFMGQPGVDALYVDPPGRRLARVAARTRTLRESRCRAAVVFPPSFSSALPPWLARVPVRVGFRADGRSGVLTHALAMPPREEHLTVSYARLAREAIERMGGPASDPVEPALVVTEGERAAIRRRLGTSARDNYVVVVPGAAFGPAKSWPAERYAALCARLVRETCVVLAGSRADRAVCERVAREIPGVCSLAGETSLGELFALVEGARALVANDSGAPHVAAALNVPCVVLFGSTSPAWTAPAGPRVRVLQHRVHCNPCFRRTCPTQLECFHGIEVDSVWSAVTDALRDAAAGC
jgi:heptosyltransferase-2